MDNAKLKPPFVPDKRLSRIVQDLYDQINKIRDSVNRKAISGAAKETEGKPGDIRVGRGPAGDPRIELRLKEGWARTREDVFSKVGVKTDQRSEPLASAPSLEEFGGFAVPQLDTDPVAPEPESAWVKKTLVAGAGGGKPIGLLLALTEPGTGGSITYQLSYRTLDGTTKRVSLT